MDDSVVEAGMTVLVDICAPDIIPGFPLSPADKKNHFILQKYSMQAGGDDKVWACGETKYGLAGMTNPGIIL